eukprot:5599_1
MTETTEVSIPTLLESTQENPVIERCEYTTKRPRNEETCTLRVNGFERWDPPKNVRNFLDENNVKYSTFRKMTTNTSAFVDFSDGASMQAAREQISQLRNKRGKLFKAFEAKVRRERRNKRRKKEKKASGESAENSPVKSPICAVDVVTPLHRMPYDEQLRKKQNIVRKALKTITKTLTKECNNFEFPCLKNRPGMMCCAFEGILASPVTTAYRNKDALTFGLDRDGKPALGYIVGKLSDRTVHVESPTDCIHVPEIVKFLANCLTVTASNSGFSCYEHVEHTGVWRRATFRIGERGKTILVIIQIKSQNLSEAEDESIKKMVCDSLMKASSEWSFDCKLTGILLQRYDDVSNAAPPDLACELLWGESCIQETLNGVKFQVSPNAFFQVNTIQAERLYEIVANWSGCTPNSTVLDICCGTGTIGLTLARKVKKVIGLELVEEAIEDAKRNAELNGITNTVWMAGKAEETISAALEQIEHSDGSIENVVGIVDPPRPGLHRSITSAIRTSTIQRLIYVSCNPASCATDVAFLCKPVVKHRRGSPFKAVRALAVDLFPHAEHCEMVILLERCSDSELPVKKTGKVNPDNK